MKKAETKKMDAKTIGLIVLGVVVLAVVIYLLASSGGPVEVAEEPVAVADEPVVAKEPAAVVEEPAAEEVAAEEPVVVSSGDIDIYGSEGFSVESYTARVGEPVVFMNALTDVDPISKITLNIQNQDNLRDIDVSSIFDMGETYAYTFDEAGEYMVWTVGYGVKMPITVVE